MGNARLVDLSQPFGDKYPLWPYFADVKIERMHYHAKSGVLSQVITTTMHCTPHADSPAYVFESGQYSSEIPLEKYYGSGAIVNIPNSKWGVITAEDLENARPKIEDEEIVLGSHDLIYIGPEEGREIINRTNLPASMLVIYSYD
jgi:kynurenine formamidase